MNFGFTEEQELLRKTARDFLGECAAMKRVREVMQDPEMSWDAALWELRAREPGEALAAAAEGAGGTAEVRASSGAHRPAASGCWVRRWPPSSASPTAGAPR